MNRTKTRRLVLSAMFIAIGYVLPFFTGQLKQVGKMLLPMHLPVFLCGMLCGWQYGLVVGIILPLLRSLTVGMPVLYPSAIAMAFELAAYGGISGFLYRKHQTVGGLYASLVAAMLLGRVIWGMVQFLLLLPAFSGFTLAAFWAGAFAEALPGIVLQLVLVPAIVHPFKKRAVL